MGVRSQRFISKDIKLEERVPNSDSSGLFCNIEKEILNLQRNVQQSEIRIAHLEYVKNLAKNNIPTLLIKEILQNESLLKTIAERSYEHVNHFDKIVLINNPDPQGFRLTLHLWNYNYDKKILDEELIHNHRFSFWSHIYRGTLLSENFEETPYFSIEKKNFKKFIYTPSKTGNIHTCSFEKNVQLTKIGDTRVECGETYYLDFKTIHRVILPRDKNLCTFVLRGPRERDHTNTYNTFYPDRGIESSVPMMKSSQLKQKLLTILGE